MSFNDLQFRNRKDHLNRILDLSLDQLRNDRETVDQQRFKKNRIQKSLFQSDDYGYKLGQKIKNCKKQTDDNKSEVCQSLWCPNCRKTVSDLYFKKITNRISDQSYQNKDFKHISGYVGLCNLDFDQLNKMIKDDGTYNWRKIRRRFDQLESNKNKFIESIYEFELVDWTFLQRSIGSDYKKKQIKQMMEFHRSNGDQLDNKFLFVHYHSITNLTKKEIRTVCGNNYYFNEKPLIKTDQLSGLFVQRFYETNPLPYNLTKLTSYPFKNPYRYKHSFIGSDHKNGEYFEEEDLSKLISIYQKIQKRSWRGLFRSVN